MELILSDDTCHTVCVDLFESLIIGLVVQGSIRCSIGI